MKNAAELVSAGRNLSHYVKSVSPKDKKSIFENIAYDSDDDLTAMDKLKLKYIQKSIEREKYNKVR